MATQSWRLRILIAIRRKKGQSETSNWSRGFLTHSLLNKLHKKALVILFLFSPDQGGVKRYMNCWTKAEKQSAHILVPTEARRINKAKEKHIQQSKERSNMSSNLFCYYWNREFRTYTKWWGCLQVINLYQLSQFYNQTFAFPIYNLFRSIKINSACSRCKSEIFILLLSFKNKHSNKLQVTLRARKFRLIKLSVICGSLRAQNSAFP